MIQLVQPDLNIIGTAGLCEKYTEDVFRVTSPRHDADATDGWNNDKGQHPGETPPANLSVPIAFEWVGDVDGVTKNWGHRCVWVKGKVYSSPLSGTGHLVYDSIPAIQEAFGLGKYLGWSEYIEDKQIVKEDDMPTAGNVNTMLAITMGRKATQPEIDKFTKLAWTELMNYCLEIQKQHNVSPIRQNAILLKTGIYEVK